MSDYITIGMDLGNRKHTVCAVGAAGELLWRREVANTPEALKPFFEENAGATVAMETGLCCRWISAHRCRHASSPAQAEVLMSPRAIATRLKRITRTEHLRETVQREGQRELREYLLHKRGRCAVTGLRVASLLVASHIKDWKECTRDEKLDQANVLLLARNYDAAFDRKLISFDSKGKLVKSDAVSWQELSALGIKKTAKIARPSGSRAKYLRWHLARLIK